MKLKLVMSNAETGEALYEETDLNFAMISCGRRKESCENGSKFLFNTQIEARDISSLEYVQSLLHTVESAKESACENGLERLYAVTALERENEAFNRKNCDMKKISDGGEQG